jgi:signal transduction histidine kinase
MTRRLLSGFLAINILVFTMGFFVVLWRAEVLIQETYEVLAEESFNKESIYYEMIDFEAIEAIQMEGTTLPEDLQIYLPFQIKDAERDIFTGYLLLPATLSERIANIKYSIGFSINDSFYRFIYNIGPEVLALVRLLFILLLAEAVILLRNIVGGHRVVRDTLRPLAELAEKTKTLNTMKPFDEKNLREIAGEISSIDVSRLDKRISVDGSQNELKDLTFAINGMLTRINQSYQSQVRFVSDASHELRTPIAVIQGYINLLDRWGKNDEKTRQESIDAIKSEIENMKDLVEKLLFLARGDNETIQLHMETIDACEIIDEIIKETQMIDMDHIFKTDLSSSAFIEADRQLFKQTIRILVDNSIKYSQKGKEIKLKVTKDKGKVVIMVQDTGIGIPPEDLPHIFDRFYRSDESRARKSGGSGLGLSIAKWIIERHGAFFEIQSRLNIGTRISIVFPEAKDSL